ncbi:MAG: hypothetical protein JNL82_15440 [Myxococcales bacterium]|nr:hypothetical protein [Myxococcales bacterium]
MRRHVFIAAIALGACTPDQPTTPPEKWPDIRQADPADQPVLPASPGPAGPALDSSGPVVASPGPASSHEDPRDVLAPPRARNGLPARGGPVSGCEGGNRSFGDTWKVDCNECSCGSDGQVTCTAMACGYH